MAATPTITQDMLPTGWTLGEPYPNGVQVLIAPERHGWVSIDPNNRIFELGSTMRPRWQSYLTARTYKGRGWLDTLVHDAVVALEVAWQ